MLKNIQPITNNTLFRKQMCLKAVVNKPVMNHKHEMNDLKGVNCCEVIDIAL